jgi:hypothetical protein
LTAWNAGDDYRRRAFRRPAEKREFMGRTPPAAKAGGPAAIGPKRSSGRPMVVDGQDAGNDERIEPREASTASMQAPEQSGNAQALAQAVIQACGSTIR